MNMYAIVWNDYVKDLVIAESEAQARELASDDLAEVNARDTAIPCLKMDDDLQTMTNIGIMSVRQIVERYEEPMCVIAIDDIRVQFSVPNREEQ